MEESRDGVLETVEIYSYDDAGRLAESGRISRRYLVEGGVPAKTWMRFHYDAEGRTTAIDFDGPDGPWTGRFEYEDGQLTKAMSQTFVYGTAGRVASVESVDERFRYQYDAHGRVVASMSDHARYEVDYDKSGRPIRITDRHDDRSFTQRIVWRTDGRIGSTVDALGTTTYEYDKKGRPLRATIANGLTRFVISWKYACSETDLQLILPRRPGER